jgi:hypothetical protein
VESLNGKKQNKMVFRIIQKGKNDHRIFIYENIIFMVLLTKNGTFKIFPKSQFFNIPF